MKAGVWTGPGRLEYQDWPDPVLLDDGVIVRVAYCGICGSDTHIVEQNLPIGPPPQVIGHEVSGVIQDVGRKVRDLEPGMPVACNFYGPCGACAYCRLGQPNHCVRMFYGAKGLAQFAAYRADLVYPLPDGVDLRGGALLEPTATCLYAVEQSELRPGERVLVIGAGPMGLLTAQLARRVGAARVVVTEPDATKRELALAVGADDALDPRTTDLSEYARTTGEREGFDVIYDAAGAREATAAAVALLAKRGRLMIIAVHGRDSTVEISPFLLYQRELVLRSAYATADTFARALPLLRSLRLDDIVTAVEPLADISNVYQRHRAGEYTKVLISPE